MPRMVLAASELRLHIGAIWRRGGRLKGGKALNNVDIRNQADERLSSAYRRQVPPTVRGGLNQQCLLGKRKIEYR